MKDQDNQLIKRRGFLLAHSFADPVHNQSFYCSGTVIRQCVLVEETIHSFSSQEAPRSRIPIPSEGKLSHLKASCSPETPLPLVLVSPSITALGTTPLTSGPLEERLRFKL